MGNFAAQSSDGRDPKETTTLIRRSSFSVSGRYFTLPKKIDDDYFIDTNLVLGTGMNGSVFKAQDKPGKKNTYAVKGFTLVGISQSQKADLVGEAEIFLSMDHPHVARLIAVYESEAMLHLVMECMEGGELFDRVVKKKRYGEREAAHSMWQMLLAVHYLHSREVVHRDLKLENFLYEKPDNDHLKLIDFGFSKVWDTNTMMAASCGTLSYVAPEVLEKSYTKQCDLWSLGVVCFILTLGYMPFAGKEQQQIENIKKGHYVKKDPQWKNLSENCKDFLLRLLKVDPNERMTTEQALKHTWIADRDQTGRYHITPLAHMESRDSDGQFSKSQTATLHVEDSTIDALCNFQSASRFRRACMSLMAWSLTQSERAAVRDAFIELDVKRQGTISMVQLQQVLKDKFAEDDERLKPLIASVSASPNDEIHYSEFLAAMVSTRIAMNDAHIMATFRRFDVDNSGFISQDNLRQILGPDFQQSELAALIKTVDPENKDKISYESFVRYLRSGNADTNHTDVAEKLIERSGAATTGNGNANLMAPDDGPMRIVTNVHTVTAAASVEEYQSSQTKNSSVVPEASQSQVKANKKTRVCAVL